MSIIEQAAKRLEELRRAGVEVPWAPSELSMGAPGLMPEAPVAAPVYTPMPPAAAARRTAAPSAAAAAPTIPVAGPAAARSGEADAVERHSRLVELDLDRLARAGYLVPGRPEAELSDEFRVIKRPLIKNAQGQSAAPLHRPNLILVTSAMPGEGKSFCAINLALSIAMEVDKTVLLVDADVVRPSVMSRLGLGVGRGLLDVLKHPEMDLSEVLLRTNVPKLSVLPTGAPGLNSNELLASTAMERLLDELATRYADRIVIFDAPPLLPTTESRVLASRVGQVVMVVEAGRTTRAAATEAFAALESCPVVMSVLNKTRGPAAVARYGY
ncbi:XrtA-associated tyrosine autokinase [Aquabacterium sp. A7-Y]|uniref:XrtA-associated tyrosine autokinase n=1 Tax=Aquabacterium sp. A7-Y TaxID=1349605 RepID=UPI00223D1C22|nr:XrtA-associated tyrosine autokinase [Aquabacterium sp. A7-Y]MCW7537526.1 XrtA-associated tyrosine autokinase [Aquabacterium sp. A7-Y]